MDALSQVVAVMRTGRPRSFRLQAVGSWGWRYPPVRGAAFHVVLQGSCWLRPEAGEPVALSAGDVVLFPHGTGHGLADAADTPLAELCAGDPGHRVLAAGAQDAAPDLVVLCGQYLLDRDRPHPMLAELPDLVHLPNRLGRNPSLHAAVELLGREVDAPAAGSDAVVPALLDALLLYVLRAWFSDENCAGAHPRGWGAALRDDAVAAALTAIHEGPERPWTVESLGAVAGLSRAAFARRFTALVGSSPLAYLTWWRMTTAARLLADTDLPVGAVARRVGYTSEFAFAAAFKREYARPPGRYRTEQTAA
ncbi:AraC family transcriptional regulator [Jiangella rhizosphaerae]|uniref:AraC family transcriptional regulator n=1 Tax=Jiangella rhizosphaerae TaxID=2293569 RepID=A0A418KUW9_9ACTN|nr:AraC family transcriptional regulator [Jiangella rhizosphaerae]RIQ32484.1 AraC family transcriptional regulator [Jiangella rhizosphaerae]